ncbi:hypothetical protein RF11_15394 [Thelohanellus kitauei]|uniref:Uncharacterized protein n=1 Tax=Thelohanellus kitauei TaxID=669202 RepID=A0A0C2JB24_THEKT|nr:hypothetical protein RF11_15394 [Thelohanellus kitauei]
MNLDSNDNGRANEQALQNYHQDTQSYDSFIQFDLIFLKDFPIFLSEEFERIITINSPVENHQDMKFLLLEVFTFIFRNPWGNIFKEKKSETFVIFLLKFIQTYDRLKFDMVNDLIDSINVCISHEPYRMMFIEENATFHFYYYFGLESKTTEEKFWDMCENVYHGNEDTLSQLNVLKLNKSINDIMTKFAETKNDDCVKLYFMTHIINDIQYKCHESNLFSEFNLYKDIMEQTLIQFNESNYLEKYKADYYMSLCQDYSMDLSVVPSDRDQSGIIGDSKSVTGISTETNLYIKNTLIELLKRFTLLYEMKYIFGDTNSSMRNLNFQ